MQLERTKVVELVVPLSEKDQNQLERCEDIIGRGLGRFFEVGSALLKIREKRLYRGTHPNFEVYCRERWGIGRSYAWRLMGRGAIQSIARRPERAQAY